MKESKKDGYGWIGFQGLEIECIIGLYPAERQVTQKIFIDLKVEISKSFEERELVVDYDHLVSICRSEVKKKNYLLETLASRIMRKTFEHPAIKRVTIRIEKPRAIPGAKCAFVELSE